MNSSWSDAGFGTFQLYYYLESEKVPNKSKQTRD